MGIPRDAQDAEEVVRKIATDRGYLPPEEFRKIPDPETRRKFEESFLQKNKLIESSVIALAKDLYASKARFIYELLQNADNNSYTRAEELGDVPYVSFSVYHDRVVVESNEDGFTTENLMAICSVGNGAKAATHGYIGEKGIGFKSVFMVANNVHIQSGPFSFAFSHNRGDSGMGMISPTWVETKEVLASPLTRITLDLHKEGGPFKLNTLNFSIQSQLSEMQETFLLFMKRLKRIEVFVYGIFGFGTSSATYTIEKDAHIARVSKTTVANGKTQKRTKCYHTTTHVMTNLPKHDLRTYSNDREQPRYDSESEIILAFPIPDDTGPTVDAQTLFTFLPVGPVGFKFIIQADFVMNTSGQNVMQDSLRNQKLLDGISSAFAGAVSQFCEHDTLKYQWIRYMPHQYENPWGPLWLSLVNKIVDRVRESAVLYGRRRPGGRFMTDLYRLHDNALDEQGNSLFDDGEPEQILSERYDPIHLDRLAACGLQFASIETILEWAQKDLSLGPCSRMRSSETSAGWHTRAAELFNHIFDSRHVNGMKTLKTMSLLPLEDGTWVTASAGAVYFACTDGMDMPHHTSLRFISRSVTDPHRLALFEHLGVTIASVPLVRKAILRTYAQAQESNAGLTLSLQDSKRDLEFLYRTEHLEDIDEPCYDCLTLLDITGTAKFPASTHMYIVNHDRYGPRELLQKTDPGQLPGDGAPGYDACFVNEGYFTDAPETPPEQFCTWLEWFYDILQVQRHVYFPDTQLRTYIELYRPEKFLRALCLYFEDFGTFDKDHIEQLRNTAVLCQGIERVVLKNTYFATTELKRRVERFVEPGAFFPWLWTDEGFTPDVISSEWNELFKRLGGAGLPLSKLDMALDMLRYSVRAMPSTVSPQSIKRLFSLYHHLMFQYCEYSQQYEATEKIRAMFLEDKYIYIPLSSTECAWAFPSDCVWEAPQGMTSKFVLQRLYQQNLTEVVPYMSLEYFFNTIVGVAKCTWETYVGELEALKGSDCKDLDIISGIFEALGRLQSTLSLAARKSVRHTFEENALIYCPSVDALAWHKVSQCVWSNAATLRGKVTLNDSYENLQECFVDLLGVQPVDLRMAIDELKEAAACQPISEEDVTRSIWTVNSLLSLESDLPSPQDVLISRVFPVRFPNKQTSCQSSATDFIIIDRETLGKSFASQVKCLVFTLEEVVLLSPFFEWTGLQSRYLSRRVRQTTHFNGGDATLLLNPDRQIRNRAHALLRLAAHFGSPRTRRGLEAFYDELRNSVDVVTTDEIDSIFHLVQDGVPHKAKGKATTLLIKELDVGARIYLPRNRDDQEYAFTKLLARPLFEWMMEDKSPQGSGGVCKAGVDATRDVLAAPRTRLDTALDDNGIARIDIPNLDEERGPEAESPATLGEVIDVNLGELAAGETDSTDDVIRTPPSSIASPSPGAGVVAAASRVTRPDSSETLSLPVRLAMPAKSTPAVT